MSESLLLDSFDLLATAPGGLARLRELILTLAIQGKLVPQSQNDESSDLLLQKIQADKARLVSEGKVRRGKSLDDISSEDASFELPHGWIWVRLNSIGDWGAGATPSRSTSAYYGGSIPWFKSGELTADYISASEETVTDLALKECSLRLNQVGDVLVAMYGATIGKTAILTVIGTTNQAVCACTPFAGFSNNYLLLLLKALKPYFISIGAGGAQPNISREKLINTVIGLPPAAEQARIVARVKELMKLCDTLELTGRLADEQHAHLISTLFGALAASESAYALAENWQRVAENFDLLLDRTEAVDALEQTILRLAMRGNLVSQDATEECADKLIDDLARKRSVLVERPKAKSLLSREGIKNDECPFVPPSNWCWARIEDVCDVQGGIQKTQLRRPVNNHFPYLRVGNVQREKLNLDRIERYELTDAEVKKWALEPGDLLVVEGNGSADEIGRCAVWDGSIEPCVYQNHLMRVRPDLPELVGFLSLYLNSPDGTAEMRRLAITTSGLFNLSVGKIRNIPVPLPPLAEQRRIVERVHELRRFCAALRAHLQCAANEQIRYASAIVDAAAIAA